MIRIFKKTYTNKRELEIETFFKNVNWYKLLKAWGIFPSFKAASETIMDLRSNTKCIKKTWLNNLTYSLPQVLSVLNLLPQSVIEQKHDHFAKSKWYFSTYRDLMEEMNIPKSEFLIWCSSYNMFGKKRKQPSCSLIKNLSTWHIKRILKTRFPAVTDYKHDEYKEAFIQEIRRR